MILKQSCPFVVNIRNRVCSLCIYHDWRVHCSLFRGTKQILIRIGKGKRLQTFSFMHRFHSITIWNYKCVIQVCAISFWRVPISSDVRRDLASEINFIFRADISLPARKSMATLLETHYKIFLYDAMLKISLVSLRWLRTKPKTRVGGVVQIRILEVQSLFSKIMWHSAFLLVYFKTDSAV